MIKQKEASRFLQLIKALDAGWEIDQPVLLRATWRTIADESGAYHFILRQKADDRTTLLSLPPSPELLAFLADNKISISTI
jgi:hypothetical protein